MKFRQQGDDSTDFYILSHVASRPQSPLIMQIDTRTIHFFGGGPPRNPSFISSRKWSRKPLALGSWISCFARLETAVPRESQDVEATYCLCLFRPSLQEACHVSCVELFGEAGEQVGGRQGFVGAATTISSEHKDSRCRY